MFNHNLETVPSNYLTVRPGARYFASIRLLQRVKEIDPTMFTKSGIMVGLGEERNEVLQVMDDLRSAEVDFLTIGQYLQPSRKHHPVEALRAARGVQGATRPSPMPRDFRWWRLRPLTRSSHHAGEDFARLTHTFAERADDAAIFAPSLGSGIPQPRCSISSPT